MSEKAPDLTIELLEIGASRMFDAIISVAQTTMAQQVARGGNGHQPFVGFLQALVAHREGFTNDVLAKTIRDLGGEK